jgi:hypothetical protein
MVPNIINTLKDKWKDSGNFQDFVNDWAVLDNCPLAEWCREQGDISFSEGRRRFRLLMSQSPMSAYICHYNIGFLVDYEIRMEWTLGAARNPAIAAKMWLEDETLTEEQDIILENAFRDSMLGLPQYIEEIDNGITVRKKTIQKIYNENSEITQGIISRANNN